MLDTLEDVDIFSEQEEDIVCEGFHNHECDRPAVVMARFEKCGRCNRTFRRYMCLECYTLFARKGGAMHIKDRTFMPLLDVVSIK